VNGDHFGGCQRFAGQYYFEGMAKLIRDKKIQLHGLFILYFGSLTDKHKAMTPIPVNDSERYILPMSAGYYVVAKSG
jgi:hypothetical protein